MKFVDAVNYALHLALDKDPKVLFYGLGANDPKRLFGTSKGLVEKFGQDRVFDMPTSELAMTGVGVGVALAGYRPIMCHQRLDFALLSVDQIVNSAAKWFYMFGGQDHVPLTIRFVLGRGWGQGPTHCQSLQSWFAHVPGLKVVMPSTPQDAKTLLLSSIFDENPVIYLEHRWLHDQEGSVSEGFEIEELGKAKVLNEGTDLTIVSLSYMTIEAIHAVKALRDEGVSAELIDLRSIVPMDWNTIAKSIRKTGRLLVLDTGAESFSVASEIISRATIHEFSSLRAAPRRLASPDCPVPTSFGLSKEFYPNADHVIDQALALVGKKRKIPPIIDAGKPHDVPGSWFKGPF